MQQKNSTLIEYSTFVSQFLGAGFVAGSVVHFGEGITIWDTSILVLGIVLFTASVVYKEGYESGKKIGAKQLLLLIISSLFLSLTIGMASGGTQHFVDTPEYASVLIAVGLTLGYIAFSIARQKRRSLGRWIILIVLLIIVAGAIFSGLQAFNTVIPDSIREGHGSHGAGLHADTGSGAASISHQEEGDHPHE